MLNYSRYKRKEYVRILKLFVLGLIFHSLRVNRTQNKVIKDYSSDWDKKIEEQMEGEKIYELNGNLIQVRPIEWRKFHINEMSKNIRALNGGRIIKNVLELGSGDGFNILSLAVLHPEIKNWTGVDISSSGTVASNNHLKNPPIKYLEYCTELDKETILKRLGETNINFKTASILELPFDDNIFEFCYSINVVEQIPRDYLKAFAEARRVSSMYACFFEEFKEAQKNIFQRMNLKNVDYFRYSYREVERVGFKILKFEPSPLRKIQASLGLLVCSKDIAAAKKSG